MKRTVVITGSSRGFGLALAKAFLLQEHQVVIASRTQKNLQLALSALTPLGTVRGTVCDVSDLSAVETLSQHAIKEFGSYQVWINNAGISGPYGGTYQTDPTLFRHVCETNILGTYHGSITALQHFHQQSQGTIINILGAGYKRPAPYQNAYGSSKSWSRVFTQALAKENEEHQQIHIAAYQPGMMLTDLIHSIDVIDGFQERLRVYPKIVKMLAVDPILPAQKLVKIVDDPKKRKSGKIYRYSSSASILWRMLTRANKEPEKIDFHVIPPFR